MLYPKHIERKHRSMICSQYSRQRNNKKFSTTLLGAFSMSKRRSKHTLDERIEAVLRVIEGRVSVSKIAKEYSVDRTTINLWVRKYEADGVDGLKEARTWKKYSSELKRTAVEFDL